MFAHMMTLLTLDTATAVCHSLASLLAIIEWASPATVILLCSTAGVILHLGQAKCAALLS